MNERIIKLYEQSFVTDPYVNVGPDGTKLGIKFDPEKFAELIVEECINVCKSRVGNSDYNTGRMHCVSDLREHFGVEE